jgi:uncharacterized lipoprotein YehR (DUF1307 family)
MRNATRINRIIVALKQLWHKYPDWRFGQLLENDVFVDGDRGDATSRAMFYQGDIVTLKNLEHGIAAKKLYVKRVSKDDAPKILDKQLRKMKKLLGEL